MKLHEIIDIAESIRISGSDSDDTIRRKMVSRGKNKKKKRFGRRTKVVGKTFR